MGVKKLQYKMLQGCNGFVRLAQLDRAFGYGPKGRGFESSNARIKKKAGHKSPAFFLEPCGSPSNYQGQKGATGSRVFMDFDK